VGKVIDMADSEHSASGARKKEPPVWDETTFN
jgi:hypothetical protein